MSKAINRRRSPEYIAWEHIKSRCCNPNSHKFKDYGGRGIAVCERWLHRFENFLSDMGKKPFENAEIDRIDVNGNYEPENCRWVTRTQNSANKRKYKNNTSGYKGVYWYKAKHKYAAQVGVNGVLIHLGMFKDPIDAALAYDAAAIKYFGEYAATNKDLGLL